MTIRTDLLRAALAAALLVLPVRAECPCNSPGAAEPAGGPVGRLPDGALDLLNLDVPFGFAPVGAGRDAASGLPLRIRHLGTGMQLVLVPAAEFRMGAPEGQGNTDEHPRHRVLLSPFWIGVTEVTNGEYRVLGDPFAGRARGPDRHPVVDVSWQEADQWSRLAGLRLPTEAEWEAAARGTTGRRFPWGNTWNAGKGNFSGRVASVGSRPGGASPYGCLDMAGNAWEWCADLYDENYYARSPLVDPAGPAGSGHHVIRGGGSGDDLLNGYGVTLRAYGAPAFRSATTGFRAAVSPWRK